MIKSIFLARGIKIFSRKFSLANLSEKINKISTFPAIKSFSTFPHSLLLLELIVLALIPILSAAAI
ncbi:MAG: hypothetical protein MGG11_17950 [Trichodesmium sp. MAG_R03]|nr:hypothetical protein [Trichodesmium sp. MAG_R03]